MMETKIEMKMEETGSIRCNVLRSHIFDDEKNNDRIIKQENEQNRKHIYSNGK